MKKDEKKKKKKRKKIHRVREREYSVQKNNVVSGLPCFWKTEGDGKRREAERN